MEPKAKSTCVLEGRGESWDNETLAPDLAETFAAAGGDTVLRRDIELLR
jgi:hypothetical protein